MADTHRLPMSVPRVFFDQVGIPSSALSESSFRVRAPFCRAESDPGQSWRWRERHWRQTGFVFARIHLAPASPKKNSTRFYNNAAHRAVHGLRPTRILRRTTQASQVSSCSAKANRVLVKASRAIMSAIQRNLPQPLCFFVQ